MKSFAIRSERNAARRCQVEAVTKNVRCPATTSSASELRFGVAISAQRLKPHACWYFFGTAESRALTRTLGKTRPRAVFQRASLQIQLPHENAHVFIASA